MPLTLRHYRRNILLSAGGLVLLLLATLTATAVESPRATAGEYVRAVLLCVGLLLPFLAYNIYMYTALRRDFSAVEPLHGTVANWKRGAVGGSARLLIAHGDRIYGTPAIFGRFSARRWCGRTVEFAVRGDGYVFVYRVN